MQVGAFVGVEAERAGDGVQDVGGHVAGPALFQARVVVDAHPCQQCQFLPAQTRHAPLTAEGAQTIFIGAQAGASGLEELTQLPGAVHDSQYR
ncbi:hypothetical protein GCM10010182_62850 [Actinomadura cremea]|nr:hypothetical protein GCM10010182_62850 [Actinomadura cremea]